MLTALIQDVGGADRAARILGVHVSTVYRWQRSAVPIPKASYQALLAASTWGRQDRAIMTLNERRNLYALADALKRENAQLRASISKLLKLADYGAANAPIMAWVGGPLSTL